MAGSNGRRLALAALVLGAVGLVAVAGALARARSDATQRTAFSAVFHVTWAGKPCTASKPARTVACDHTQGPGVVSSLGKGVERYDLFVLAPSKKCSQWRFSPVLTVAGKGTLRLRVKSQPCVDPSALDARGTFVVVGGSGSFAGASGSGTWIGKDGKVTGKDHGTATDVFRGKLDLSE